MNWQEESAFFITGMVPGFALQKQTGQALVRGKLPGKEDVIKTVAATVAGSMLLSLIGGKTAETAQYLTLNQLINVKKSADTGVVAWRLGPRMVWGITRASPIIAISMIYNEGLAEVMTRAETVEEKRVAASLGDHLIRTMY